MAVAKARFPLDEITGILGKVDRSVGREQGLALCISSSPYSSILSKKTKKTTTKSPAQQKQAKIYCDCDHRWATLGWWKQWYTCKYRKKVQGLSTKKYTWYLCWMSLCMTKAWDENLFVLNSYVSRFVIKNESGSPWINHKATLTGIPVKYPIGWDVQIQETDYKRLPQRTLEHSVQAGGTVFVCLPDMNPGRTIYIDVYSWGDYSTPQNCPDPWINRGQQYGQTMIRAISHLGNGIAIAGTYPNGLNLRSADNGLSWTNTGNPGPWSSASDGNGNALIGCCWPGKIRRSTDYGISWNLTNFPGGLGTIISLIYLEGGITLAGTSYYGQILRSTDNGLNWTNLGAPVGNNYIEDFAYLGNGIVLAACSSRGYNLRSTDYGLTWSNLGSYTGNRGIHCLCAIGEGVVVSGQINRGHIYRSTDYGLTWANLGEQYGEWGIYQIVKMNNGVAYAGTADGGKILKSTDNGLNWTNLGNQFGQSAIYSLEPLDNNVIVAGTHNGGLILRYGASYPVFAPESTIKIGPT